MTYQKEQLCWSQLKVTSFLAQHLSDWNHPGPILWRLQLDRLGETGDLRLRSEDTISERPEADENQSNDKPVWTQGTQILQTRSRTGTVVCLQIDFYTIGKRGIMYFVVHVVVNVLGNVLYSQKYWQALNLEAVPQIAKLAHWWLAVQYRIAGWKKINGSTARGQ